MSSIYFKSRLDLECTICFEKFKNGDNLIILPCKHFFCRNCIQEWIKKENICPICRNDNTTISASMAENKNLDIIKNDYDDYLRNGGSKAPVFYLYINQSQQNKLFRPINRKRILRVFLNFDFAYYQNSQVKIILKDLPQKINAVYNWTNISHLDRRFIFVDNFKNLSCALIYIKYSHYNFKFHLDFDIFQLQSYDTNIHINIFRNGFDLNSSQRIDLFIDPTRPFSWNTSSKLAEKHPVYCEGCDSEQGFWSNDLNCESYYNSCSNRDCGDEIYCCTIL